MPYNRVIYLGQAYGVQNPTIKATACNRPSDVTHLGVTQIGRANHMDVKHCNGTT